MIVRTNKGYVVKSDNSGREFGTYKSMKKAKQRLAQIEFFKHLHKIK